MNLLGTKPKAVNWKSTRDEAVYAAMKEGSIWLGYPGGSEGDSMLDVSSYGNDGVILGSNPRTSFTNHGNARGMFKGNGGRYIDIPTTMSNDDYTIAILLKKPLYDGSTDVLIDFKVSGTDGFYVFWSVSNALYYRQYKASETTQTIVSMTGVPENETILYVVSKTGTTLNQYVYHKAGVISTSDTLNYVHDSEYVDITLGARRGGSNAVASGAFIGLTGIYNDIKSETWGQNVYDTMMGKSLGSDLFESDIDNIYAHGSNIVTLTGDRTYTVEHVDDVNGAYLILNSSSGEQSEDLIAGEVYEISMDANVDTGTANIFVSFGSANYTIPITDESGTYKFYVLHDGTISPLLRQSGLSGGQVFTGRFNYIKRLSRNGVLAPQPLPYLSPLGTQLGLLNDASEDFDMLDAGIWNYVVEARVPSPSTGVELTLRQSENSDDYVSLEWDSSDQLLVVEYESGSPTTLATIADVDDALMRIVLLEDLITVYKNGATTASASVSANTIGNRGTYMSLALNGDTVDSFTVYDDFGKAPSNVMQLAQLLDARALFYGGLLAERLGYSDQDAIANELRSLNDEFNFGLDNNSLRLPYNAELDEDQFLRIFATIPYSRGTGTLGTFYRQDGSHLGYYVVNKLRLYDNFDTTDLDHSSVDNASEIGKSQVVGFGLDVSNSGRIFIDGIETAYDTDIDGVGSRTKSTNTFVIGNNSATTGTAEFYGRMSLIMFLALNATDSLMQLIQRHVRIRDYYADSMSILSPDVHLIPSPDGTFIDIANDNAVVSGTNLALASSVDSIGNYPVDFDGTSVVNLFSSGVITGEFQSSFTYTIRLSLDDWTPADSEFVFRAEFSSGHNLAFYIEASTGRFLIQYNQGASYYLLHTPSPSLTGEHEIIITFTDSLGLLFLDGFYVTSVSLPSPITGSFSSMFLGGYNSGSNRINGTISEFAYSTEALLPIDILRYRNLIEANGAESMKYTLDNHSPVVLLPLNEASGSVAYNLAAPTENFTIANIATYQDERAPNGALSMEFNGTNSVIYNPSPNINPNSGTFMAWFSFDNFADGVGRVLMYIYANADNNIELSKTTSNRLQIRHEAQGSAVQDNYVTTLTKSLIAVRWDDTNDLVVLNVDGVDVKTLTGITEWITATSPALYIGSNQVSPTTGHDGKLSLPVVCEYMTEAEILAYYESSVGTEL